MKRTPLQRRTPLRSSSTLKASSTLRRGGRLRAKSPNRVVFENGSRVPPEVVQEVLVRSRGICERCGKEPATDLHHRVTRGRGGPDDAFNLAHLCTICHHVHAHGYNEYPWLVRGSFTRGVYVGPDDAYREHYAA